MKTLFAMKNSSTMKSPLSQSFLPAHSNLRSVGVDRFRLLLNGWGLKVLSLLLVVMVGGMSWGQAASGTWGLTSNATVSVSGNVTGSSMVVGSGVGTLSFGSSNGSSCDGWNSGSLNSNDYCEYSIAPTAGNTLSISGISFFYSVSGSSMNLAVYYSTDNFSSTTQLGSNVTSFSNTSSTSQFSQSSLSISVANGSTLKVRVYGWGASTSTRTFRNKNFVITGTTASAPCTTPDAVSSLAASVATNQSNVTWTNGACFAEMMLVVSNASFTAASPAGDGTAYTANSLSFTDGSNTTFDGGKVVYIGSGTAATVTSLTNGTAYNYKMFTRKGTNWTNATAISQTPTITYCASTGPSSQGLDYFTNFTTTSGSANINNTSTFSANGYGNFTAQTVTQTQGGTINYSAISPGIGNGSTFSIFVDWNQDGDFSDASEEIVALGVSSQITSNPSGSFSVPVGATLGNTRMRIIIKDATGANSSCNNALANSETEDYTFTVTQASPTISNSGTLSALTTTYGTASSYSSFTISGSNLNGTAVTVTPPAGFEVATSSDFSTTIGTSASSLSLGTATSISSTTIYVRLSGTSSVSGSPYSGNIVVAGGGATSQNVATVSSTVSKKALTITAANQSVAYGTAVATVTGNGSYTPTGFVNSETSSVIGGTASYTTTYTISTAVGSNVATLAPVTTNLTATNYSFTAANGNISVTATTPSDPTITSITPGNQELSVAFTAGATGGSVITNYKYSTDGGITFVELSPASTTSPITITGLTNDTQYDVQIKAVNAQGDGAASASSLGTPTAAAVAPGAPTISSITPSDQQLSVAFTAGATGGSAVTTYKYSTNGGSNWQTRAAGTTASPLVISTLSTDGTTALTNGTSYNIQIKAVNAIGDGAATTSTVATPATTPSAPSITLITQGNGQLSVAFTSGATGGSAITNYKYSTDGGSTFTSVSPAATTSPITITGLSNGTSYNVQIKAVNVFGDGIATASTAATPITTPGAPTIGTATAGNGQATVTFTAPASNGGSAITSYTATSTPGSITGTLNQAGSGTITVTGLTNGTAYTFSVKANNAAGASTASAASNSVTPVLSAPVANAASNVSCASFTANWDVVNGATGYNLDVYTNLPFKEDFTDGDITSSPVWSNTTNYAYETASSLTNGTAPTDGKYIGSSTTAGLTTSLISSSEVSEWNFSLGSTSQDFSSTNYFGVILMSSESVANISASFNGYYLKCGVSSVTDMVELWKSTGATKTKLGDFSITLGANGAAAGVNLKITRNSSGVFQAYYSTGFTYAATPATDGGTFTDNTYSSSSYFGLFTNFTNVSNSRRVYLDNLVLATPVTSYVLQNSIVSGTSQAVSGLTEASTFYYIVRANSGSSTSGNSSTITVTTATPPTTPTGTGAARCDDGTVTISATPSSGATIDWYSASTGGTLLASGSTSYTTPVLSLTTDYYAEARNTTSGCTSAARVTVTATVNITPSAPTASATQTFCTGATISNLSATGSPFQWYAAATSGSPLSVGSSLVNNTHYYVSRTINGCESSRTDVTATVNANKCNRNWNSYGFTCRSFSSLGIKYHYHFRYTNCIGNI
jgi:predicted RNA-binding protein with TRAM domain